MTRYGEISGVHAVSSEDHLLLDILEVLVAPLLLLHVGRQVGGYEADGRVVHRHTDGHAPFVSLQQQKQPAGDNRDQKQCLLSGWSKCGNKSKQM